MGWFKRLKEGITTTTTEKRETPEGLWYKCPSCKKIHTAQDHKGHQHVCIDCGYHERISSSEYFEIIFDENQISFNTNSTAELVLFVTNKNQVCFKDGMFSGNQKI